MFFLVGLVKQIAGDSWFTCFNHLAGKSNYSPKRPPMAKQLPPPVGETKIHPPAKLPLSQDVDLDLGDSLPPYASEEREFRDYQIIELSCGRVGFGGFPDGGL